MLQFKHSVFVSSVYNELKDIRAQIILQLLEDTYIPVAMEVFGAKNETVIETIREYLRQSQIVVLIIGNQYGSTPEDSPISYTEMEYNIAKEQNKIILAFFYDKGGASKNHHEIIKLKNFKERIEKDKTIVVCDEQHTIITKIASSLRTYKIRHGYISLLNIPIEENNYIIDIIKHQVIEPLDKNNEIHDIIKQSATYLINLLESVKDHKIYVPTHVLYNHILKVMGEPEYNVFYLVDHAIFRWNELVEQVDHIAYNTFDYSKLIMQTLRKRSNEDEKFNLKRLFLVKREFANHKIHGPKFNKILKSIKVQSEPMNEEKIMNKIFLIDRKPKIVIDDLLSEFKEWKDFVLVKNNLTNKYLLFVEEIDFDHTPDSNAIKTQSYVEMLSESNSKVRKMIKKFEQIYQLSLFIKDFKK